MTLSPSTVILVDSYRRTPLPDGDESNEAIRLGNALSSSGLSITLTSLCSVMAFFVGSFVDIPGISAFCVYAAWSFLANDILQFLLFVPLMVIDNRRIRKKRNFCCPCFCGHDHVPAVFKGDSNGIDGEDIVDSAPRSSLLSKVLLPVMTKRTPRLLIIASFLCTLCGSIYVIPSIKTETEVTSIVLDGSMVLDFQRALDSGWDGTLAARLDVVIKNQDFSDIAVRDTVYELIADLESQDDALGSVEHWLNEFAVFLRDNTMDWDTISSFTFYRELQSFSNGTRWESEIIYDDPLNPAMIQSTRFKMTFQAQPVSNEYTAWNELFDAYFSSDSSGYIFYELTLIQHLTDIMLSLTASNMVLAGIGVLSVLIVFVDLRMALFLLVIVSMIDVHLMAWMWALGISLEGVTFIDLVMAVGLTVDYLIHITHSIAEVQPRGDISRMSDDAIYNSKLEMALNSMGVSVCKGALTTFIGVAALAFSQSESFRIFFKMFGGIILVSMAHGMMLTPALLGECRFFYHGIGSDDEVRKASDSNGKEFQNVGNTRTGVIGMVKKATSLSTNDGTMVQLEDDSGSDND